MVIRQCRENVVVVRADIPTKLIAAYVVLKQGQWTGASELRALLKRNCPTT